jgi:muramoyltetrapeptide carboxypeptidase
VPPLRPGDAVAVVAPSGPFDRPQFELGLAVLATRYRPVLGEHLFEQQRYLAGPDAHRLSDLQQALDDGALKAVFAARGGYGAMRLLPGLRPGPAPKALVGFSDTTALHLLAQRHGLRSLHAPVLTQLGRSPPEVIDRLFAALEGRPLAPLQGTRTITPGEAEGPLLGGNLSVLTRLLGTPWFPSLRGAVLLLEDVGEQPYRLDRLLTHLSLAGALEGLAGLVVGELTGCEKDGADYSSADVVDELVRPLGIPAFAGLPVGHGALNFAVPLGARVRLEAGAQRLTHLEGLT